jgi:hypothetical protein
MTCMIHYVHDGVDGGLETVVQRLAKRTLTRDGLWSGRVTKLLPSDAACWLINNPCTVILLLERHDDTPPPSGVALASQPAHMSSKRLMIMHGGCFSCPSRYHDSVVAGKGP